MRSRWSWLLMLAMPLFAWPLWSAMGRIDPLFMLPPAALAMAGWWTAERRVMRAGAAAMLSILLVSYALTVILGRGDGAAQAAFLAGASGGAVLIHRAISGIGHKLVRNGARIAFVLTWLFGSIPLISVAYRPPQDAAGARVVVITSLPLNGIGTADNIGAALRGEGETAPILSALQQWHRVRFADSADARTLSQADVVLLAQPRALPPETLVAIDEWVRDGGRALVLADPLLLWPAPFALGDPRNPSPNSTLSPLLTRWGLMLDPPREVTAARVSTDYGPIRMVAWGWLTAIGPNCRITQPTIAQCRLDNGRAMVVADADWLHHALWSLDAGRQAGDGDMLTAANAPALSSMIDELSGRQPRRAFMTPIWQR